MNEIKIFLNFLLERREEILRLFTQHIELTVFAVFVSVIVGVPIGILITRVKKLSSPVIGVANIIQSIPSLAFLGFLIPILGIGSKPAITMVVMYSLLPIIKSTFTGLNNINSSIMEAAKGIGLTKSQILLKVQLPLAMPVIMSGIRISAVTAVGLMTIAAFIGAGGLGYLVFSGVQTVNNNMILAGAIPACILAVLLDFIIGKIENILTPEGVKVSRKNYKKRNPLIKNKKVKTPLLIALALVFIVAGFSTYKDKKNTIIVGSKSYNEQLILGNILASLLENNTSYKVEKKLNLGGTSVVFNAMKSGNIDLYVEYTGTGLVNIMKEKPSSDPDKTYNIVKEYFDRNYDLKWLKPVGFNNTYVLGVKQDTAKKYNLNSLSDLAKSSGDLNLGCSIEFANREDGYLGLKKHYGLNFKDVNGIDGGLRYSSLESDETQVTDAFSTDGLLKKFDLKLLKDDKGFFPPYYAVPLVRKDILEKYPDIEPIINKLQDKITDETMRNLNYKVDNGEQPEKVAEDFLKSQNLIK